MTGGTGTPRTSTRATRGARPTRPTRPPGATWPRSSTSSSRLDRRRSLSRGPAWVSGSVVRALRHHRELADAPRVQPLDPQPVGGEQVVQRALADLRRRCPRRRRRTRPPAPAPSRGARGCGPPVQTRASPARSSEAASSSSGVSQTVSASGIAARSAGVSGCPLLEREGEAPAGRQRRGDRAHQRVLVLERQQRLEQEHDVERHRPGAAGRGRSRSGTAGRLSSHGQWRSALALASTPR